MNVRKAIDYSELFEAVDKAVCAALPQMELYREIGRLICERPEKGAAVAVAEHLQSACPDISSFSPRNVRRMRDFCITYKNSPDLMDEAMQIGWTQNLVIMESTLSLDERAWYIRAARRYGWSKQELTQRIAENAHMDHTLSLDTPLDPCYTDPAENKAKENSVQDTFLLPPHQRKTGQSHLSPGPPRTRRTRRRLCRQNHAAVYTQGLSALRSADWHRRRIYVGYAPYPRRQPGPKNSSADGTRRTSRFRNSRLLVNRDFKATWRDVESGCKGLLAVLYDIKEIL